jgi:hypothetical protein
LAGAALGAAAIGVVLAVFSVMVLQRYVRISWGAIGSSVFPSPLTAILTSLPPITIILTIGVIGGSLWRGSIVATLGAIGAWLAGVFLVRHPLRRELSAVGSSFGRKIGCRG